MSEKPEEPVNPDYDWESDAKTPVVRSEPMADIMETLRSPGIPTLTCDRPTKPCSPAAIREAIRR